MCTDKLIYIYISKKAGTERYEAEEKACVILGSVG